VVIDKLHEMLYADGSEAKRSEAGMGRRAGRATSSGERSIKQNYELTGN